MRWARLWLVVFHEHLFICACGAGPRFAREVGRVIMAPLRELSMRGLWVSFVTLAIVLLPLIAMARPQDNLP